MDSIAFNTGRKYTAHGQRIIATWYSDGVVTFHDIDRAICGEYTGPLNKEAVLRAYDNNEYTDTLRAAADAFYRGGANTASKYAELTK